MAVWAKEGVFKEGGDRTCLKAVGVQRRSECRSENRTGTPEP